MSRLEENRYRIGALKPSGQKEIARWNAATGAHSGRISLYYEALTKSLI